MPKISNDEARWQLEDDIRTLRNYAKLVSDKKRYDKAKAKIDEEIKEYEKLLKSK